jgi:Flp pilus assembly protein TadG/uncharacterized membrane protein (UPF0127 family)
MEVKFCVYNETRQSFLSLGVNLAGASMPWWTALVTKRTARNEGGVWVKPSQAAHTIGAMFPVDLIYLDADRKVIHLVEHLQPFRLGPIRIGCESVLEMPPRTIHMSQTRIGDRVLICSADEMGAMDASAKSVTSNGTNGGRPAWRLIRRWIAVWRAALSERRAHKRLSLPVIAYYWTGGVNQSSQVKAISLTGAYIVTEDRWSPGTVLMLTLQYDPEYVKSTAIEGDPGIAVAVRAKVVHVAADGIGVRIIFLNARERQSFRKFVAGGRPRRTIMRRGDPIKRTGGQALVEFALVIPLLFLFVVNVVNFGGLFFAWITVANAARAGAQYAILAGATVLSPTPASGAQIASIITNDISALPNRASLSVRICTNNNGVLTVIYPTGGTCPTTGSAAIATDPEPTNYVLASIDVTYTYVPLVAAWDFSRLNIHLTLPATTIHRRSVMRMLQ